MFSYLPKNQAKLRWKIVWVFIPEFLLYMYFKMTFLKHFKTKLAVESRTNGIKTSNLVATIVFILNQKHDE